MFSKKEWSKEERRRQSLKAVGQYALIIAAVVFLKVCVFQVW